MLFDLIIGGLLCLFVALGAWRGTVASLLALVSLVAGYAAAIYAATHWGEPFAQQTGLPPVLGAPLAGTAAFIGAFLVLAIVGSFVKRWDRNRLCGAPRGAVDRLGGALFGGVRGAAIAALIAWLGLWLDAARSFEPDGPLAAVPQAEGSRLAAVTETLVEGAVEAAFGDAPGGQLLARLAARPSRLRGVRDLLENPRMTDVQDDAFFWTLVQNGAADRALNRLSFYQVSHDPELRAQLAELGLVSEAAAEDSSSFRNEVREVLQKVGPRIRGLKRDPEIRRLAADPEITAMLQNGDTLGLITHPDIQALATRLATQPDPDA